jgi:hypothetical protein
MELVYDSKKEDVYEPFILKIDGQEYKLKFPVKTEKVQRYYAIMLEGSKKHEESEAGEDLIDKALSFMLGVPQSVLDKLDHRFKVNANSKLADHLQETEKKNPESSKQLK